MRMAILTAGVMVAASTVAVDAQANPPQDPLRAVYLSTNPAQAVRDSNTGAVKGTSYDVAMAVARKLGRPLTFTAIAGPPAVIEAEKNGDAYIAFVAYGAPRLGTVEFSQTYMAVQQSFLVLDRSD